jgi:tetratricopeptide (TPR) repeat protein
MSTDKPDLPEEGAKRTLPETEAAIPQLRPTWLMMEELARLLHLVPDEAERNYGLALIHRICQRDEEAIKSLQIAVEANPQHSAALSELGEVYFKQERYEDAVQIFEQVVKLGGRGSLTAITWLFMSLYFVGIKISDVIQNSILRSVDPELALLLERKLLEKVNHTK